MTRRRHSDGRTDRQSDGDINRERNRGRDTEIKRLPRNMWALMDQALVLVLARGAAYELRYNLRGTCITGSVVQRSGLSHDLDLLILPRRSWDVSAQPAQIIPKRGKHDSVHGKF